MIFTFEKHLLNKSVEYTMYVIVLLGKHIISWVNKMFLLSRVMIAESVLTKCQHLIQTDSGIAQSNVKVNMCLHNQLQIGI
jgi:hypothetical protein